MKNFPPTALILFLLGCSDAPLQTDFGSTLSEPTSKKPNILLLYMDDLRPQLNSYGYQQVISPNIDALANRSIQFTQAYSNVSVCGASRASMLTGMLPTKTRFINYSTRVDIETPNPVSYTHLRAHETS